MTEPEYNAKLVALSRKFRGHEYTLGKETCVIGRNDDCDIPMQTQMMSRRHAEFQYTQEGLLLRDLGSHNGTFVNGEKISERIISAHDKILIGGVRFKLQHGQPGHADDQDDAEVTPPLETIMPDAAHHSPAGQQREMAHVQHESPAAISDQPNLAESETVVAGKNIISSGLFMGILAVAIVIGVIVLLSSMREVEMPPKVIKLKAGEERVISTKALKIGTPANLKVSDSSKLRAKFYTRPGGQPVKWIIEVRTLDWSNPDGVILSLINEQGDVMQKLKIIIEGKMVSDSEQFVSGLMSDAAKQERAVEFYEKGKSYEESSPRDALVNFKLSYEVVNKMGVKPVFYSDLTARLESNQAKVNQHIKQLWDQFYYNLGNDEKILAQKELKNIMNFVHDHNSVEYQRALIYFNELAKSIPKTEK